MSAKYMILGALMQAPDHGYNLKTNVFRKIFGDFGINDGQLYPLLSRLEKEELIRKEIVWQEGAPNRHRYYLTDAGRAAFMEWLRSDEGEDRSFRYDFVRKDVFFTRCNYIRHLDKAAAIEKVEQQINAVRATIDDFSRARDAMLDKGVDPFRVKILGYGIKTHEARLEWLQEFLDEIKKDRAFAKIPAQKPEFGVRSPESGKNKKPKR